MLQLISRRFASNALLLLFSLVILFHIAVMAGIVPFTMVWGGRLKAQEEMILFEAVSILLNSLMLAVVAIKAGFLNVKIKPGMIKVILWMMAVLFALNTIGNLFSNNQLEKIIFTPVTFILALCCLRLTIAED